MKHLTETVCAVPVQHGVNEFEYKLYHLQTGFELIGKYSQITEEQAASIVEKVFDTPTLYKDYSKHIVGFVSAKSSLMALMQVKQCYTVNPFGDNILQEDGFGEYYNIDPEDWKEAQQDVADDYLLIMKVN